MTPIAPKAAHWLMMSDGQRFDLFPALSRSREGHATMEVFGEEAYEACVAACFARQSVRVISASGSEDVMIWSVEPDRSQVEPVTGLVFVPVR